MSLGTRIKKCRKSHNFTQKELSNKLGLTPKMISFYENDQRVPPVDILIKLSQIFSVSTDYLLELNNNNITYRKLEMRPDEELVLSLYSKLEDDYKDIVIGELKKCVKMQEQEIHMNIKNKKTEKQA